MKTSKTKMNIVIIENDTTANSSKCKASEKLYHKLQKKGYHVTTLTLKNRKKSKKEKAILTEMIEFNKTITSKIFNEFHQDYQSLNAGFPSKD